MAIEKRIDKNGKPRYRVRIATHDPLTGKRRNVTIETCRTRKEAEEVERKALTERDRGTVLDPSKTTVAELLDTWFATKVTEVSAQNAAGYEITIRVHLKPAFGSITVQRLTAARVQAQYGQWREAGMGERTMQTCHLRLSQALDQAVRFQLVASNVCKQVTPPRSTAGRPDVWGSEEANRFLQMAKDDPLSPLWHLLLLEGMRRGEALGLRWADISWDRGTAHISQSVRAGVARGEAVIQPRTKTAVGARTVKLTSRTLAVLKHHRATQAERRLAAADWVDHDLILTTGKGTPINPGNVRKHFEALVTRAGVRRITPHGLGTPTRHCCCGRGCRRRSSPSGWGTPTSASPSTPTATSCPICRTVPPRRWTQSFRASRVRLRRDRAVVAVP